MDEVNSNQTPAVNATDPQKAVVTMAQAMWGALVKLQEVCADGRVNMVPEVAASAAALVVARIVSDVAQQRGLEAARAVAICAIDGISNAAVEVAKAHAPKIATPRVVLVDKNGRPLQ